MSTACPIKENVGGAERVACMAAGGLLLLRGIIARRALGTMLGGLLVYRGITGNCKAYELLDIDTRSAAERGEG